MYTVTVAWVQELPEVPNESVYSVVSVGEANGLGQSVQLKPSAGDHS